MRETSWVGRWMSQPRMPPRTSAPAWEGSLAARRGHRPTSRARYGGSFCGSTAWLIQPSQSSGTSWTGGAAASSSATESGHGRRDRRQLRGERAGHHGHCRGAVRVNEAVGEGLSVAVADLADHAISLLRSLQGHGEPRRGTGRERVVPDAAPDLVVEELLLRALRRERARRVVERQRGVSALHVPGGREHEHEDEGGQHRHVQPSIKRGDRASGKP